MKKFVIGLGMVLIGTGAAMAQDTKEAETKKQHHNKHQDAADKHEAKSPEVKAGQQAQKLAKELALSEDQIAQTKSIILDFYQKKDHLKEEGGASHGKVRELEDARDLRLKSVFSKDQYNTYTEKEDARQEEADAKHEAHKKAKKAEKKAAKNQVKKGEEQSKTTPAKAPVKTAK